MSAKDESTYEDLIHRAVERMKSDRGLGQVPECQFCGRKLRLRRSNVASGGGENPCRDDQMWKCCGSSPEKGCKNTETFGIPISREVLEEEKKMRGGNVLAPENTRFVQAMGWNEEKVKQKLRDLGYIDN